MLYKYKVAQKLEKSFFPTFSDRHHRDGLRYAEIFSEGSFRVKGTETGKVRFSSVFFANDP